MNDEFKNKRVENRLTITHVISEPGDATQYNYAYIARGDSFNFMPIDNDFKYPQIINYWDIKDVTKIDETVMKISKEFNCNPCTTMECIRTMQICYEDEKIWIKTSEQK